MTRPTTTPSLAHSGETASLDPVAVAGALDGVPDAPLHLTRRGRLAAAAAVMLVAVALVVVARASWRTPPSASSYSTVTVRVGDTLWSIASAVAPKSDPREVVAQLRRLNKLDSVELRPGQQLRIQ